MSAYRRGGLEVARFDYEGQFLGSSSCGASNWYILHVFFIYALTFYLYLILPCWEIVRRRYKKVPMNKKVLFSAIFAFGTLVSCEQTAKADPTKDGGQVPTEAISTEQPAKDLSAEKKVVEEFVNSFYEGALSCAELSFEQLSRFLYSVYSDSYQELAGDADLKYIDFLDTDGNTFDLCENLSNASISVGATVKNVVLKGNTAEANVSISYGDMVQPLKVILVKDATGDWKIDDFVGTHGSARINMKK